MAQGTYIDEQHSKSTFFLDRSIQNPYVRRAFQQKGENVVLHDDHFRKTAEDEEWLEFVGIKKWIVISKDKKIKNRILAIELIKIYKIGMFVLANGQIDAPTQAEIFSDAIPKIQEFIKNNKPLIL